MNKKKSLLICLVNLLVFYIIPVQGIAQSAWTKKKGELYSQFSFNTIPDYNEIFSSSTYITSRNIFDNTIQLYGEYGINDNVTILVNIPIKSIRTTNEADNASFPVTIDEGSIFALGNFQIGLRYNITDNKYVFSSQLTVETNSGTFDNNLGIRTGYDAWTFTPTINLGRSFTKYYFQVFSGFDIRTNSYSSNFKLGGEIGLTTIKKTTLIAFVDIVESFDNGSITEPVSSLETALYINNQEYTGYGLKVIYEVIPNFGFIAGFGGAFTATNVAKQAALNVGLFYKI